MALILADDFQQLAKGYFVASGPYDRLTVNPNSDYVTGIIASSGYAQPATAAVTNADGAFNAEVVYDGTKKALLLSKGMAATRAGGERGLMRKVDYEGSILRFSFLIELHPQYKGTGVFLEFGTMLPGANDAPQHTVSISAGGTYMLNGTDTNVAAYYNNVKVFHEVVFTDTTVELWVTDRKIAEQARPTNIRITSFRAGFVDVTYAAMWLHSLIIADNTGTVMNGKIGRKLAKSYEPTAQETVQSTIEASPANSTALAVIKQPAEIRTVDTGGKMLGSLVSPSAYVLNSFSFTKDAKKPVAACVNIQAKRRERVGDGLVPIPFITIDGVKTSNAPKQFTGLWNQQCVPIAIDLTKNFTAFSAGYEHDYVPTESEKLFIDDRSSVDVYGS